MNQLDDIAGVILADRLAGLFAGDVSLADSYHRAGHQ